MTGNSLPTATDQGHWVAAADGGVFTFGDAAFGGSMGGVPLNQPVVRTAATPDGRGNWLVAPYRGNSAFREVLFPRVVGRCYLHAPAVGGGTA